MRLIEFTKAMRPYGAGETLAVPNDVADRLIAAGEAKARESVFDQAQPAPEKPKRGKYLTRKVS